MSPQVLLLSGPNLNELGRRSTEIYGTTTLDELVERFRSLLAESGYDVDHVQSNFEGELVEAIHDARITSEAIVINGGALSHTSWSLRDALESFGGPKVEVHLSNPSARETFRHRSALSSVVDGVIAGFREESYVLAAYAVRDLLAARH